MDYSLTEWKELGKEGSPDNENNGKIEKLEEERIFWFGV